MGIGYMIDSNVMSGLGDPNVIAFFLVKAGGAIIDNMPILFAIGVAIGMAKREKEVAALASVIAFFIMHTAISALISVNYAGGDIEYGRNGTGCCEFGAKSRSERCNVNGTWYIYA